MNVVYAVQSATVQTDVTQKIKSIVRCRAVFHRISALINFSTVVKYKTHFSIIFHSLCFHTGFCVLNPREKLVEGNTFKAFCDFSLYSLTLVNARISNGQSFV